MGRAVIVAYRPKPGMAEALKKLVDTHVHRLRDQGLATDKKQIILQAADGILLELFEWVSPEAIQQAHTNQEVLKMWGEFAAVCDYLPLSQLPEAQGLFAEFTLLSE